MFAFLWAQINRFCFRFKFEWLAETHSLEEHTVMVIVLWALGLLYN